VLKELVLFQAWLLKQRRRMNGIANLKLSLTKFGVNFVNGGAFGLRFVKCLVPRTKEEVVTDHPLVSGTQVRDLDGRG